MTIQRVPPSSSGRELNAISSPSPIATEGTAMGRWKTASVMRRNQSGASRAASAAHVPTISAMPPARKAVCRLTDRLARSSPDSAVPNRVKPRFDGSGPVQDPASPASTTVPSGSTNTTATTSANTVSTTTRLRGLHSNIRNPYLAVSRAKITR